LWGCIIGCTYRVGRDALWQALSTLDAWQLLKVLPFKLHWRLAIVVTMPPIRIVEELDVIEYIRSRLVPSIEDTTLDSLCLEQREEARS